MLKRFATGLIGLTLLVAALSPASAEKRVALVIGNSAYKNTTPLKNPSNDAVDMAEALRALDFEVIDGTDLRKRDMMKRIRAFAEKLDGADVGLFFYAGHGLQVDGRNFLAPVDAALKSDTDLDFEAIELNLVLKQLERNARLSIVFLDACRDNPLARNLVVAGRSLAVGRGLAQVEKAVGMMIAFATQPGNIALDGEGRNSPFTKALLQHIGAEGASINDVMIDVRRDVLEETKGKQVPWENSSLTGQFYFKPTATSGGGTAEIAALRDEIARLKEDRSPAEAGENATAGQADDTSAREIAVEPAGAGEAKTAETASPETKTANLEPAALTDTPSQESEDKSVPVQNDPAGDQAALNRDIQEKLKALNCYTGRIDGDWGRGTRGAVKRFNIHAKTDLKPGEAEPETLEALDAWTGAPCPVTVVRPKAPAPKTAKPKTRAKPKTYAKPKTAAKPRHTQKPAYKSKQKPSNDFATDAVHKSLRPAR